MSRPNRKVKKVRLNLELSPAVRERLDALQITTDADSLSEVIRHSLAVYEKLWEVVVNNDNMLIVRDSEGREREFVFLR